jgi:uncharacterized protein YacL
MNNYPGAMLELCKAINTKMIKFTKEIKGSVILNTYNIPK